MGLLNSARLADCGEYYLVTTMTWKEKVYKVIARIGTAGIVLAFLSGLIAIDFYLPTKRIVTIIDGDVKRVDEDGIVSATNPADGPTRDVFFIFTNYDDDTLVFRNEDTGWGFPFYFKFNSADVQAEINTAKNEAQEVMLVSYGWRVQVLSMFPNVIGVKSPSESPQFSILKLIAYATHIVFWGFITFQFRTWMMKTTKRQ